MSLTTSATQQPSPQLNKQFVLPGVSLDELIEKRSKNKRRIRLGPGIRLDNGELIADRAGPLCVRRNPDEYYVDTLQRRYVPVKGELVLGTVLNAHGNQLRVDIGTSEYAVLSIFAFEGATKKNRPDVKVGDLVYGRLLVAGKDVESELVCINSKGKKGGLGILPAGGYMFTVPIYVTRRILHPENNLLKNLGTKFKCEITAGMNGRIWVKASTVQSTIYIKDAISRVQYMTHEQFRQYSEDVLEAFVKIN